MSSTMTLTRWLILMTPVVCCLFASRGILHYFQLESYQFPGYFRTLGRNRVHSMLPGLLAAVATLILYYLFDVLALRDTAQWVKILAMCLLLPIAADVGHLIARCFTEKRAKKKFVYTGRVKRLYVVFFLVMTLVSWLCSLAPWGVLPALWPVVLPLVVALSGLVAWAKEKAISECYFRDARRKLLANPRLLRIGITGS